MEAIGHAGTCLGILANDGVLLAAERRNTNKLLDEVSYSEKIYKLYKYVYIFCLSVEGFSSLNYAAALTHWYINFMCRKK